MKNNKKLLVVIGIIVIFLILVMILFKGIINHNQSNNVKLDKNYQSLVGIQADSDIILVINSKNKVATILYLNPQSTSHLANQKIEGKDTSVAIELIVDKLKNSQEFDDHAPLHLLSYQDSKISNVLEQLNKQFVIYGVNNEIITEKKSLNDKMKELKLSVEEDEITTLYNYSKRLLKNM